MLSLGFALAAGVGATALQGARRSYRAHRSHPPEGQFLQLGDARVHAVEMGQPAGRAPDVVLIHGSNGSTRDMSFRLAPALADRYRVLMFDRPGLGYSDPLHHRGASLREQAEVLQQAATTLGATRPIVLGQSYGAGVALAWGVHHPDSLAALVSISGVSHPWDGSLDPFYRVTSSPLGSRLLVPLLSAFVPQRTMARALEEVFAPQGVPEGYAAHFGTDLTLRRGSLRANARQRANLFRDIQAQAPQYHRISAPAELLHGDADTTVGHQIHADRLVQDLPDARLTLLPGIGHMPHHVATDEVAAAVDRAAQRAGLL
ncbi:alpha/beta hydrolase [Phaeobacter sp. QD34_3]|uniref:alpha/beta fold hydrolase n=1 Tax=unclassified Phaeobacter TaxID=2621772 RepID=UPI00237F4E0B|nr:MULTISPECIES: alpha/beta hydrolase [unclassified Phaeobacter]MDE4131708.1 alpha/beta hydrolase [Phaeobacter sp. QD34_3]MDE4135203.1 alpha/beta hydrolase [Phaeobacter sp. QD34_24]